MTTYEYLAAVIVSAAFKIFDLADRSLATLYIKDGRLDECRECI